MKALGVLALVGLAALVSGCENVMVNMADNVLSSATGRECSVSRLFREVVLCRPEAPEVAAREPTLFCYRTLGTVDCYAEVDPYKATKGLVNQPRPPIGD